MDIRPAQSADLPAMMEIYHDEVMNGLGTFDTEPLPEEKQVAWFDSHAGPRRALLVGVEGDLVVAWGSLKAWSERRAYDRTAEVAVYVQRGYRAFAC